MRSLTFSGETRVRRARFEERSALPVSAACVVATAMRDAFATVLRAPVSVRLLEPAIPPPEAWPAILHGALLYRICGSAADAAIVLRPIDAIALAGAAFGEPEQEDLPRELSPIERDLLDRAAEEIAGSLSAVCGARERPAAERVGSLGGFVTYFEVLLEQPVRACVGVALSRDPAPEPRGRLGLDDLGDVSVGVRVLLDVGSAQAATIARLAEGSFVPITASRALRGTLAIGERTLAHGACGVRDGRYALEIAGFRKGAS